MNQAADRTRLASLTAEYWQLDPEVIDDNLPFSVRAIRNFNSMRFFRFLASIEDALGVRIPDPGAVTTYGVLSQLATNAALQANGHQATEPVQQESKYSPNDRLQPVIRAIGHDIEEIASLPEADDYHAHPFYAAHFTTAEIDYCMRSTNPRQHFAARFCAKEAVRKCGPRFAALNPLSIEVINSKSGQPSIHISSAKSGSGSRLLLSLSHSELLASAFVIVTE